MLRNPTRGVGSYIGIYNFAYLKCLSDLQGFVSANKQPIVVTNSSAPQVNQAILLVLYMVSPLLDCNLADWEKHMVAKVYN